MVSELPLPADEQNVGPKPPTVRFEMEAVLAGARSTFALCVKFECPNAMTDPDMRSTIEERLKLLKASAVFHDINHGHSVAPLTDYHVQQIPEGWSPPPPDYVDGRELVPVLKDNEYRIYCHEAATGLIHVIDMESPWPPADSFATWHEFNQYLFQAVAADQSDEKKAALARLLELIQRQCNDRFQ